MFLLFFLLFSKILEEQQCFRAWRPLPPFLEKNQLEIPDTSPMSLFCTLYRAQVGLPLEFVLMFKFSLRISSHADNPERAQVLRIFKLEVNSENIQKDF